LPGSLIGRSIDNNMFGCFMNVKLKAAVLFLGKGKNATGNR